MDAAPSDLGTPVTYAAGSPQMELLIDAIKPAVLASGEHRLFRSGKLSGLFPSRTGSSAELSLFALKEGLLETLRTETRGKIVTEWVRATPKAVAFVHEHESPKTVLRELKDVLATTKAGVPAWMEDAKSEIASLSSRFEQRAKELITRLDQLAAKVDAALRRAEMQVPSIGESLSLLVPWGESALQYLDNRAALRTTTDCPLPELFEALREKFAELTLSEFHNGLKRLHDTRAIRLLPAEEMTEPEYALVIGGRLLYLAAR